MQTYNHKCIKCATDYSDDDIDAYYCTSCLDERKKMYKQMDARHAEALKSQPKSDYQLFDELSKLHKSNYINAKELGL